jgi:hypothetical protein
MPAFAGFRFQMKARVIWRKKGSSFHAKQLSKLVFLSVTIRVGPGGLLSGKHTPGAFAGSIRSGFQPQIA